MAAPNCAKTGCEVKAARKIKPKAIPDRCKKFMRTSRLLAVVSTVLSIVVKKFGFQEGARSSIPVEAYHFDYDAASPKFTNSLHRFLSPIS
jgi:hypothetical protein